jgi:hypothetical protein
MNIEQLKARGYDLVVFINKAQEELQYINNEITKLSQPVPPTPEVKEEVKPEEPITN